MSKYTKMSGGGGGGGGCSGDFVLHSGIQGCTECRPYGAIAWFALGLADQSIMQLSGTFSMKHQTAPHRIYAFTFLCYFPHLQRK